MRKVASILFALLLAIPSMLAAEPPTYRGRSIAQWSDDLSHPNSVVRLEAAKMLGRLGKQAEKAVDPMISALRDRNPNVRLYAASALGRIKHQPEKCLVALIKLLEDRDEHVRFAAEWSLARVANDVAKLRHTPQSAEALETLLASAEKSLAESARNLKHLQQIADARKTLMAPGGNVAKTTSRYRYPTESEAIALLADRQSDDRLAQLKAIYTLGRVGRAAALVHAWQTVGEDGFLGWHLTQALIKIGEPAVPILTQALRDEDELVAQHATHCLRQMGPTAVEALPQLLTMIGDRRVSVDLRESAIRCVESFGPVAQNAVGTLTGILKSDAADPLVEASARALGSIGPTARDAESTLIEVLRSEDQLQQTRIAAAEALPAIIPTSNKAVELLAKLLDQHDEPFFVASLAGAIGEHGAAAAIAVTRLVELVDATSDFERQSIIQALGKIGPAANQATSRMIECLTEVEEFESVQVAAARALGKLGPDAVTALAGQLDHPHHQVRQTIARALVEIGDRAEPAVKSLEGRLNDRDENTEIQAMVAVALGQIGPAAKSAIPTLIRTMGDVKQGVHLRAMATISIGQIDPGKSPMLLAALNDADPQIRVAAAYALQRLPELHPDALLTLIRELNNYAVRGMAMRALSEFKKESRPLLTDIVDDQSRDEQMRITCLNLIGENGLDAADQLLAALNDETLAESAYWSLRDLGNDSIPMLISAVDNEEHFTEDARGTISELVDELFGGVGGGDGDGDDVWTGGHALTEEQTAAKMAAAAPQMMEPGEMLMPEPEPGPEILSGRTQNSDAPATAANGLRIVPETGFKSVKVFYGTNRKPIQAGAEKNGFQLPWYVWLFILSGVVGVILYVVKQFRRGATGRATVGVAGIILFSLAVDAAVARIQKLDQATAQSGPTYGTQYSTLVEMGFCEVTIPDVHQVGQLEGPSILRLQVMENPKEHIVVNRVQQLEPDAFFADLQSKLGKRGNSILVFVHGYNVSFESAARRTAQMSHDLKFAGAAAFYSWPSQANWRKYRVDEKNVELSINQLKTFLLDIAQRSGADTINLIAHRMGNRALTNALTEIEVASSEDDILFNQVILAAPDIDADVFKERIAPAIVNKARHITLYASSKDLALVASREFNSGDPRAGDAGADLVIVPGIDTIDVSAGESSLLGHSYYGDSASVLRDIEFLLRDQPAAERQFLEPFPRLEPTHWLFQPAATARRRQAADAWR